MMLYFIHKSAVLHAHLQLRSDLRISVMEFAMWYHPDITALVDRA